jgi:hypothetical protein
MGGQSIFADMIELNVAREVELSWFRLAPEVGAGEFSTMVLAGSSGVIVCFKRQERQSAIILGVF